MIRILLVLLLASFSLEAVPASKREGYYRQGLRLEKQNRYFEAARYFFQAGQGASKAQEALAFANVARNLTNAGMHQSASYFALRVLELRYEKATHRVLPVVARVVPHTGYEIFRKFLLKHTSAKQYVKRADQFFYYVRAKDELERNRPQNVIALASRVDTNFIYYPESLYIRGTAALLLNRVNLGIQFFEDCVSKAENSRYQEFSSRDEQRDLKNRCIAGVARAHYQAKRYEQAQEWYNKVEIHSMVWPQIQYEQAWTAVARGNMNRALGKLVTYKAPALTWFLNSEVNALRALSFYQLCIYSEVDKEINNFKKSFTRLGQQVKQTLRRNNLTDFYNLGVRAYNDGLYTSNEMYKILNRFILSPSFLRHTSVIDKVNAERAKLAGYGAAANSGLGRFLQQVFQWRVNTAVTQGGIFVRNRLDAEYKSMLANIKTMDIVELETLRRARRKIETSTLNEGEDIWGEKKLGSAERPPIADSQYYWDFNGEFWNDELGEYVFALRSECNQ